MNYHSIEAKITKDKRLIWFPKSQTVKFIEGKKMKSIQMSEIKTELDFEKFAKEIKERNNH